jgi:hypothetical protein
MNIIAPIIPAAETQAWRINLPGSSDRMSQKSATSIEGMDVSTLLADKSERLPGSLEVIWAGLGKGTSGESERILEGWVERTAEGELVRASVRTIRVLWSERRAVFFGPAESVSDVLNALSRFTVVAWKTKTLEAELEAAWPAVDSQTRLTQADTRFSKDDIKAVQRVSERVNMMNSTMLRIDPEIDQLDHKLTALSKRLFSELAAQANIEDRLDLLEEPIDHAFEQCELLNERIIESRNSTSSRRLETLIVVLLVAEVIFSSVYFFGQSSAMAAAQQFFSHFSI